MMLHNDLQAVRAEAAYRLDAMQRAQAGNRRRRRTQRRWTRVSEMPSTTRAPADG